MRILALIGGLILAVTVGVAQPKAPSPTKETPGSNQQPATQNALQKASPALGSLTVKGEGIKFFSRGEGTLTIKGHGFLVVGDLQGEVIMQGFREMKRLPRGVTLDPPMDKRIRVFLGKGTITIKGKYDSMKVALTEAEIDFRGGASFEIMGTGKGRIDGRRELILYPSAASSIFVPEPAQPTPQQPAEVLPGTRTPKPKGAESKPAKQ